MKLCMHLSEIGWLHLHYFTFTLFQLFVKSIQFDATMYMIALSLCPGCLAVRPAVNPVPLAPLTLVNAHQHWAAPMAHWRGRPAWIHPPQEQVAWAAWVGRAEAAARYTAKRLTCVLTPRHLVRRQASLCPLTPGLGHQTSAVHLRAVKTH